MKPTLFIGSSVEALPVAYAIQQELEFSTEPTVWSQGIFDLSKSTLQSLIESLDRFSFAVFVFQGDDLLKLRDSEQQSVRDNVLFELGLFIGRLGESRTFFIVPRGEESLRIPTDLLGISHGSYDPNRGDGNLRAALGPACSQIRQAIQKQSCPPKLRELTSELTPRLHRLYMNNILSATNASELPPVDQLSSMSVDELEILNSMASETALSLPFNVTAVPISAALEVAHDETTKTMFWLNELEKLRQSLDELEKRE